jgi:hypothetical protein
MTDSDRDLDLEPIEQEREDLESVQPVGKVHVLSIGEVARYGMVEVADVD